MTHQLKKRLYSIQKVLCIDFNYIRICCCSIRIRFASRNHYSHTPTRFACIFLYMLRARPFVEGYTFLLNISLLSNCAFLFLCMP